MKIATPKKKRPLASDPMHDGPLPTQRKLPIAPELLETKFWLPGVASHLARLKVWKFGGDMDAALRVYKPGFSDSDYAIYAHFLERQPAIREATDQEWIKFGRDPEKTATYIGRLFKLVMTDPHSRGGVKAMGILAQYLGVAEIEDESKKTQALPINEFEKGWKEMTEGPDAELAQMAVGFESARAIPEEEE